MYNQLPFDMLAKVFSFLSPDSLAYASSVCKHWHMCASTYVSTHAISTSHGYPPWFLALPTRNRGHTSYVYNPVFDRWYFPSLDFVAFPIHPIASIGSLVLYNSSISSPFHFGLCNPLTKQNWIFPPPLIGSRIKPAIGVSVSDLDQNSPTFKIYVAGGASGNNSYERTLEIYDSEIGNWQQHGLVPMEFAVKLTVWTSNESVYSIGSLYWITSARAYKVIGYELETGMWKELNVPMANSLAFAGLVQRNEMLTLVGGTVEGEGYIWELGVEDKWVFVEKVPSELAKLFFGSKKSWSRIRCVGCDEAMYLYREIGSEMLVWREVCEKGRWEWSMIEGCGSIKGQKLENFPIKGLLFQPSLHTSLGVPN